MFDDKARLGSRNSLDGFGAASPAVAGPERGDRAVRAAAAQPRAGGAQPVRPAHRPRPLLPRPRSCRRGGRPGGRGTGLAVREPRHELHRAGLDRAALPAGDDHRGPISEAVAIRDFPRQRPFIRNNAAFFRSCGRVAVLPQRRRSWPTPSRPAPTLPKTIQTNEDLADVFEALADFSDDPLVRQGIDQLTRVSSRSSRRSSSSRRLRTVCNYATLWFRNAASLLSEGDSNGNWQRFMVISAPTNDDLTLGPNNEAVPRALRPTGRRGSTTSTTTPTRTAPRPARRASARPATSAICRRSGDHPHQPAGQPGHEDERPEGHRRAPSGHAMRRAVRRGASSAFQVGLIAIVVIVVAVFLAFAKDIPFTRPSSSRRCSRTPRRSRRSGGPDRGRGRGQGLGVEPLGGDSPAVSDDEARTTRRCRSTRTPRSRSARASSSRATCSWTSGPVPDSPEADSGTIPASQTSAPVQIDQVLGTLQTNTRKDLQKLLVGYGEAINGEPQPGEDDDQDPEVQGLTAAEALNDSLEYSADSLRGTAIVNQALLGTEARPLEADRRPAEGLRGAELAREPAQGPHHQLQHHHGALASRRATCARRSPSCPRCWRRPTRRSTTSTPPSRPPARGRSR